VFVCRTTGHVPRRWLVTSPSELANLVRQNLQQLIEGDVKPTKGDIRCIIFGHLVRLAVWNLRREWRRQESAATKLARATKWSDDFGGVEAVMLALGDDFDTAAAQQAWTVC